MSLLVGTVLSENVKFIHQHVNAGVRKEQRTVNEGGKADE